MKLEWRQVAWSVLVSMILMVPCAFGATLFPDPGLEKTVREAAELPEGPLTSEILEGITELRGYQSEIADLTGVEHLPNLQKADLQHNNISDLRPLAKLKKLETLYLTYNKIEDIRPLTSLKRLKRLNLTGNLVKDASPLAELPELEHLVFSSRDATGIEAVGTLKNLEALYMSRMGLKDLEFVRGLKKLKTLSMADNQINSLEPLRDLPALMEISLDNNEITDISPLSGLSEVWRLHLAENRITSLDGMPSLKENARVELFDNRIEDLRPLVEACGYTGEIVIDVGQNHLNPEAYCRDIPELEARGNRVLYKYESPVERSRLLVDVNMLCAAASRSDGELIVAAANRGASLAELSERFGVTPEMSAPPQRESIAETKEPDTTHATSETSVTAQVPLQGGTSTEAVPVTPAGNDAVAALAEESTEARPEVAPRGESMAARGESMAAIAIDSPQGTYSLTVEGSGLGLNNLLGIFALLALGALVVLLFRIPRVGQR